MARLALVAFFSALPSGQLLAPACSAESPDACAASSEDAAMIQLRGMHLADKSGATASSACACNDCYIGHSLDLEKYPNARCIDGTPGFFNIRKAGSAASRKKWFLFYQGGGWCSPQLPEHFAGPEGAAFDSCYHRSTTDLGSSRTFKSRYNASDAASDYSTTLSADKTLNPLLYDWNSVLFRYCDGSSYSGMRLDTWKQGGRELHFKGGFIREAFHKTLVTEYGLGEAEEVIISGCSAGGLATYLHVDWWRQALPSAFVVALADSGYFLDYSATTAHRMPGPYGYFMRQIFNDTNASHGVNKACVSDKAGKGEDPSDCFFAQHTVPYISSPLWASQSVYDWWQINFELGSTDPSRREDVYDVDTYGELMVRALTANGFKGRRPSLGGFIESCEHHCGDFTSTRIHGVVRIDAFNAWYKAQRESSGKGAANATLWQLEPWKCRACCDSV